MRYVNTEIVREEAERHRISAGGRICKKDMGSVHERGYAIKTWDQCMREDMQERHGTSA